MEKALQHGSAIASAAAAAAEAAAEATGKTLRRLSTGTLGQEGGSFEIDRSTETNLTHRCSIGEAHVISELIGEARIRSVTLTNSGRLELVTEQPQTTFQDIFFAGREQRDSETTRCSMAFAEAAQVDVASFPDPLYVLDKAEGLKAGGDEGVLGYWKKHATWFAWDPDVMAVRDRNERFRHTWLSPRLEQDQAQAFVSVAAAVIKLHVQPSLSAPVVASAGIEPGECVVANLIGVSDEASVEQVGVCFVEVAGRGWALERDQDTVFLARLRDLDFQRRWYRVVTETCVAVRRAPSFDEEARTNWVLSPEEMVPVSMTCSVQGRAFVQIADGRGWLFTSKRGAKSDAHNAQRDKEEIEDELVVIEECDDKLRGRRNSCVAWPNSTTEVVEIGHWTYRVVSEESVLAFGSDKFGTLIKPGALVKVDKRALAQCPTKDGWDSAQAQQLSSVKRSSRLWLRIAELQAWAPVCSIDGTPFFQALQEEQTGQRLSENRTSVSWMPPLDTWTTGIA